MEGKILRSQRHGSTKRPLCGPFCRSPQLQPHPSPYWRDKPDGRKAAPRRCSMRESATSEADHRRSQQVAVPSSHNGSRSTLATTCLHSSLTRADGSPSPDWPPRERGKHSTERRSQVMLGAMISSPLVEVLLLDPATFIRGVVGRKCFALANFQSISIKHRNFVVGAELFKKPDVD